MIGSADLKRASTASMNVENSQSVTAELKLDARACPAAMIIMSYEESP